MTVKEFIKQKCATSVAIIRLQGFKTPLVDVYYEKQIKKIPQDLLKKEVMDSEFLYDDNLYNIWVL